MELISESLGLQPFYMKEYFSGGQILQANYYPSCPQPNLAIGLVKHSDLGSVTLLLQDGNPGLQVLKDGEWITVKPMEDVFVVNLGDQIEVIIYLKLHVPWFSSFNVDVVISNNCVLSYLGVFEQEPFTTHAL